MIKELLASGLLLLGSLEEASYQAARTLKELMKRLCGEELRPPANNQHQLARQVSEPPWKCLPLPQSGSQKTVALT